MTATTQVNGQWSPQDFATELKSQQYLILAALSAIATVALVRVVSCSNAGDAAASGTVTVQPLVNMLNGTFVPTPHGQLTRVPYWRMQCGTFAIIADPTVGDVGVCLFASRDSSQVVSKALGQGLADITQTFNPTTPRQYDWSDGFYLGSFLTGTPTSYIRWDGTNLEIVTPGKLTIMASAGITANGATIDGAGEVTDGLGTVLGTHTHLPGTYAAPSGGGPVTGDSGVPT